MHTPKKAARFADVTPLPTLPPTPRQPIGHVIKSWPDQFEDVINEARGFEIRVDDRDYRSGDTAILAEYDPLRGVHTGRVTTLTIGNVFRGAPFPEGYVAFDLRRPEPRPMMGDAYRR